MSTFDDVEENKLLPTEGGLGPSFASCSRIILDFSESIFPHSASSKAKSGAI